MIYSTIPTQVGAAKLRNASLLGQTVNITRIAFGDGNGAEYEPTGQETELKNQVYECPPNRIEEEPTAPSWIELEAIIPSNVGGWYLREVGCYDDAGDLIFIGNLPSSFKPSGEAGVIKDLVFEMVYDAVAADVVTIKINPNVVIATRKYVDDELQKHVDSNDPHEQYLKSTSHLDASKDPHTQYLTRADWLKHMLFKGMPMSAVGPDPDPDIWLPAGRVELLRADYPTVFEIVSASAFFTDQATIDASPRAYAGHWGTGDGATTFTTDDWALMMNIKVAGGYGVAGTTKEDHLQNITGSIGSASAILNAGSYEGAFEATRDSGNEPVYDNSGETTDYTHISFDASRIVRTDTYTDTMGIFLDHYRVIPKGVFSYA
ncbi:phage tail protein [Vibrio fluvialis]|uniref:phage tail protein n=1 Tax=Vibrio fluvialis TaxID=676 RepID=UPI001EEB1345|nr:phage tail protein [Vibrio fluvialis]MCG6410504.1 phage tail protein [Vibrio fluvialis]